MFPTQRRKNLSQGLLLSFFFFLQTPGVFANQCSDLFPRRGFVTTEVDKTIADLSRLRLNLDLAQLKGTNSFEITALNAEFKNKEQALIGYLEEKRIMTRIELKERMKQEIARLQNQQQKKRPSEDKAKEEEARRKTEQEEQINKSAIIDGTRVILHRIEPGSFKMGELGDQVDVTLTQPFEMMATPTTQIIWRKVAELANTKWGDRYQINVDPSHFKGDTRPVEQVSYDDIQIWIKALNELLESGEPALANLIPGHKEGHVYRLPTEAEWEFVMRGRGQYNNVYHFGDRVAELSDYAWFDGNSGGQTHPVAQKRPLVIGDNEFYDMHGNVWEWVQDASDGSLLKTNGTDPVGLSGPFRIVRGGSWYYSAPGLRSGVRGNWKPGESYKDMGFRLVRK